MLKKRALLSVTDKRGLVPFARFLVQHEYEILSTGGTAKLLRKNKINVTDVSKYTKSPECLGGRVKTLHPKIFGGILFRRDNKDDVREAKKYGYDPIDIVVVNLYDFSGTVKKKLSKEETVEQIDIGGPSLLRAAAKNADSVTVICDPSDYTGLTREMGKSDGVVSEETRANLAAKVFAYTAQYDAHVASYLDDSFLGAFFNTKQEMRYGENPHQKGAFYRDVKKHGHSIAFAKQHQGKQLSYNNILDADAAFELVKEFEKPTAAIIKHLTPCGVATDTNVLKAYKKAFAADTKSPFGGVVVLNRTCDEKMAKELNKIFLEIVIAPSYTKGALEEFTKKENLRVLETKGVKQSKKHRVLRGVANGLLVQDPNLSQLTLKKLKTVSKKKVTATQKKDMIFGWNVIKHVRSNAIVLVKNGVAVGIGAGQTSRVDAVELACKKAGRQAMGSVLISDAFFPFADGIQTAAPHGIAAVLHPGGSLNDKKVEKAVDKLKLAMCYCGERAFLH